jgi:hypothetical protein
MGKQLFGFSTDDRWQYENGFYITSEPVRIGKLISQYELYRSITHLPGQIVECGVFKGASFIRLAAFREILEGQASRKLIGFDAFGKFPCPEGISDQEFVQKFESSAGEGISEEELESVLEYKQAGNFELVVGNILETLPAYCQDHPELKIALLHIDVDVHDATVCILENLFKRIVPGGVLMLDDYGTIEGETRAVDAFLAGTDYKIEKLPYSPTPAYIRR